jgi:hypothetical protein
LQGDVNDHASLVAALKEVDVVICTLGGAALLDGQLKLIEAIKEVGHIKVISQHSSSFDRSEMNVPAIITFFYRFSLQSVLQSNQIFKRVELASSDYIFPSDFPKLTSWSLCQFTHKRCMVPRLTGY